MEIIPAFLKGDDLIQDINNKRDDPGFNIWWLGQSGYLIQFNKKKILIDPYLSDSLTIKYKDTDKPHKRISELVINPNLLTEISIVSSSHNHTDHLDGDTLIPILNNNPSIRFIIPEANREFVCNRVKCDASFPIGLNDGKNFEFDGFKFTGVPAKHNEIDRDEKGNCKYLGYIISFGQYNIYHSGDTLWYDEMIEILLPYNLDLAILPINGNLPERRVAGNLNSQEAVELAKRINAKLTIPCHYDLFEFNTADPKTFEQFAIEAKIEYKILRLGEGMHILKN